jgi:hypothetical protein
MYLFVRRARLAGGQTRAAMMWAEEITTRVNQVTDLGFTMHAQVFSADVGELVWATGVPDLATLEKGVQKLQVDDFYIAEQDRGHSFMVSPPTDILQNVIHGQMADHGPGSYTSAVTTVCATGRLTDAITNAITIAERVNELTGTMPTVSMSSTGPYGGITWSTSFPGIESLDAANQALAADPQWVDLVDRMTTGVYAQDPMASNTTMYRRIL